jgi:hypothetical protein
MRSAVRLLAISAAPVLLAACDNIGRAFDPRGGGPGGGEPASQIRVVPIGGDVVDGRPRVTEAFPKGGGWPGTVPIAVLFNESMNVDSISPPQGAGGSATVFVRLAGTEQALPVAHDFLLGGRLVVLRPATALSAANNASYEVVVTPEARDVDGVRFGGTGPVVVATFQPNEDTAIEDGRIVATFPRDNASDAPRETPIYALFTKPATPNTVTTSSFRLEDSAGTPIPGAISFPITAGPVPDSRIVRIDPNALLPAGAQARIVFNDSIAFGTNNGRLDFGNRTPFATFTTLPFSQPQRVTVGNASPGFVDKINAQNVANLQVDVELDASAAAGDTVVVRLYGLDVRTTAPDDVAFVERSVAAGLPGVQTVTVSFASALGVPGDLRFGEGEVTFAAQLRRGSRRSWFMHSNPDAAPVLDVTPPTLTTIGPPGGTLPTDVVTDQGAITLYGQASERLGAGAFTVDGTSANLFGSDDTGRFVFLPVPLGRRMSPAPYVLTLTDRAGNMTATSLAGNVLQRGVVTGRHAGTMTIEAYDTVTLAALAGVTVVVEPGMPQKPAAAGRVVATTGANGRVDVSGLAPGGYSVTLVRDGFHLQSLLDTPAQFVSLPLTPTANATASLSATAAFQPAAGQRAVLGCNAFDDPTLEWVAAASSAPTAIPATAVRPNRPLVVTAFSGAVEPIALNAFANHACVMCGVDAMTLSPPVAPMAPGGTTAATLALLPAQPTTVNLASTFVEDFALAAGFGTLAGNPITRVVGTLEGFPGLTLLGIGFATPAGGKSFTINGSYAATTILTLIGFTPSVWVTTDAVDGDDNLVRHRRLVSDPNTGTTFPSGDPPGVPTIVSPGGPSVGAPAVTFEDRLGTTQLLGLAFVQVRATDPAGRRWFVLAEDLDPAGATDTIQLPDLTGSGATGLANGTWSIRVETYLDAVLQGGSFEWSIEDRLRRAAAYVRARSVDFAVQ